MKTEEYKKNVMEILNKLLNEYHASYMVSQDGEGGDILVKEYAEAIRNLTIQQPEKTKCYNCHEMVVMISTGEFCPNCSC